jgi:hypothetical protein
MKYKALVCLFFTAASSLHGIEVYFNDSLWQIYYADELHALAVTDKKTGRPFISLFDLLPLTRNNPYLTAIAGNPENYGEWRGITPEALMRLRLSYRDGTWNLTDEADVFISDIATLRLYGEPPYGNRITVWLSEPEPLLEEEIMNFAALHKIEVALRVEDDLSAAFERLDLNDGAMPDIVLTRSDDVALWRNREVFLPLDDAVRADEEMNGTFYRFAPGYLKAIAYPIIFSYQCLLYNDDIMKASYFDSAEPTFGDLKTASEAVSGFVPIPIAWNVGRYEGFLPFIDKSKFNTPDEGSFIYDVIALTQSLFTDGTLKAIGSDGLNNRTTAMVFADTSVIQDINMRRVSLNYLALPQGARPLFNFFVALNPRSAANGAAGKMLILSLWNAAAQYRFSAARGYYPNRLGQMTRSSDKNEFAVLQASLEKGWMLSSEDGGTIYSKLAVLTPLLPLVTAGVITLNEAVNTYMDRQSEN